MKHVQETNTHIYFWGSFLSNFQPVKIKFAELDFHTSEQLFMFLKAKYFGDDEMAERIVKEGVEPFEAKKLGRKVKGFDEEEWAGVEFPDRPSPREDMMYIACQRKFMDDEMYELLLATGDKVLVEGSPHDKIWGVGLNFNGEEILDEENWNGLNLLGKVLMRLRDDINRIITSKETKK